MKPRWKVMKMQPTLVRGLMLSSLLGLALLLTSCAKVNSRPAPTNVQPPLIDYSTAFQVQLALEYESDPRPPCPRQILVSDCSAAKAAVDDYGLLRAQVRAARGNTSD